MKKVRIGIAGLGRLGKVHANNIAFKIPNAELVAACSIVPAELEYAKETLGVQNVYSDYREMLKQEDLDAVAIVTTSGEHCWQIAEALDAGKHVFSDKPLGVTVEECKMAEAAVERHPELAFFLGFISFFTCVFAAISFGQKHNNNKFIMSFVYYIAIYYINQIVSVVLLIVPVYLNKSWWNTLNSEDVSIEFINGYLLVALIISLVMSAVYYFITVNNMTKKLNLE